MAAAGPMALNEGAAEKELKTAAGIVSTVRGAGGSLRSFVLWHLRIGFAHVLLYLDDPQELESAGKLFEGLDEVSGRLSLVPCNAEHRSKWRSLKSWAKMGAHIDDEVQARQVLNAELALQDAAELGLAFLLHIDADEAFYCGAGISAREHFAALARENITCMRYVNFEAVAEREEMDDPFLECDLFRRPLAAVRPGGPVAWGMLKQAVEFWLRRSPHGHYYEGYANGKSATAVLPGATPRSVHEWAPLPGGCSVHNFLYMPVPGGSPVEDTTPVSNAARQGCILHFNASVGYSAWRRKYALLGSFADSWFKGREQIPPGFHRDARDVCASAGADDSLARAFYRDRVVLADADQVALQTASGLCVRIGQLAEIAKTGPAPRSPRSPHDKPKGQPLFVQLDLPGL